MRVGGRPRTDPMARFHRDCIPEPNTGCWLWIGSVGGRGYGQMRIAGVSNPVRAHVFSYERHKGPIPKGMMIRHKCDVRICVNPDHLEVGTAQDNVDDAVKRGRHVRGSRQGSSKLTEAQALYIRDCGKPPEELAAAHGISVRMVYHIRSGKKWKSLPFSIQGGR